MNLSQPVKDTNVDRGGCPQVFMVRTEREHPRGIFQALRNFRGKRQVNYGYAQGGRGHELRQSREQWPVDSQHLSLKVLFL